MTTNVKSQQKTRKVQKFVRINIDDKLDKVLSRYELEYPLFGRSDIVKLLLSQSITRNKRQTLSQIMQGANFIDIENEEDQFEYLRKHGILK